MNPDFRADRSDTPDGKGRARAAWDTYAKAVNTVAWPLVGPTVEAGAKRYAATQVADLIGFWMMWHLHGGFEGLVEMGMHPTTVWRKVNRFRTVFKVHPDEFEMPGVDVDPATYWDDARAKTQAKHGEIPASLDRKPTAHPDPGEG